MTLRAFEDNKDLRWIRKEFVVLKKPNFSKLHSLRGLSGCFSSTVNVVDQYLDTHLCDHFWY